MLLKIRTLRILFEDGRIVDLRSVLCPAQQRVLALEHCLSCEDSGGLVRSVAGAECASCRIGRAVQAVPPPAAPKLVAGAASPPVSDLMTIDVFAVRPDAGLDIVLDILIERGFGGSPVVEGDGKPIGVLSRTDILGERFRPAPEAIRPGPPVGPDRSGTGCAPGRAETGKGPTAADAMTRVAFTLSEDAAISEAANIMVRRGVHRVVVVSEDGRVTGIVTTSDVVRWVAKQAPMALDE